MQSFDFQHRTRFVVGEGTVARLGTLAAELGCKRVFVVSDPGVVAAGHFERGRDSLLAAGLEVASFHDLHENPSTEDVDRGLEVAKSFRPDLIVGLGGGSSMDCSKGINFLYSCGGQIHDYWGVGKATKPLLPMIAVPTTSGTGSEAQSFALISDAKTHVKMACGDPKAACRIAILDPELTLTMPARVTALTGIDALTHALETYVTSKRNPISTMYSKEAWRLLAEGFPKVLANPRDLEGRAQVQWGACLAGLAIESSMLGAAHASANPLTARYGIPHGQAVGLMMPHVIRWNGEQFSEWYHELWLSTNTSLDPNPKRKRGIPSESVEMLANWFQELLIASGLQSRLDQCGVILQDLDALIADAQKQWTGGFNPRPVTIDAFRSLYQAAW